MSSLKAKPSLNEAPRQSRFLRTIAGLLLAGMVALVFLTAYRERELWRAATADGATVLVGQRPWYGLRGIDLVRRQVDGKGGRRSARIVAHAASWSDAKSKANDLHRAAYGCDSPLYFRETLAPPLAALASAKQLAAYQAVPYSQWPPELRQREDAGQTLTLRDFPFYIRPATLRGTDARRLVSRVTDPKALAPHRGGSGGFHPDWCLLWSGAAGEYRLVLCFPLRQARFYGTDEEELPADLDDAAARELAAILEAYLVR